jgi:hypothetical protein
VKNLLKINQNVKIEAKTTQNPTKSQQSFLRNPKPTMVKISSESLPKSQKTSKTP